METNPTVHFKFVGISPGETWPANHKTPFHRVKVGGRKPPGQSVANNSGVNHQLAIASEPETISATWWLYCFEMVINNWPWPLHHVPFVSWALWLILARCSAACHYETADTQKEHKCAKGKGNNKNLTKTIFSYLCVYNLSNRGRLAKSISSDLITDVWVALSVE